MSIGEIRTHVCSDLTWRNIRNIRIYDLETMETQSKWVISANLLSRNIRVPNESLVCPLPLLTKTPVS